MKFQIDTEKKTIKIEDNVKLTKLFHTVKNLFPNGEWQDFTLITNTIIEHWTAPIYYREYWPRNPWWEQPWYKYSGSNITYTGNNLGMQTTNTFTAQMQNSTTNTAGEKKAVYELKSGTYNVEI